LVVIVAAVGIYFAATSMKPSTSSNTNTSQVGTAPSTLNVQVAQAFGTLDPATGNDYTQFLANINMYDNLLTQKPDGSVIPLLATKWSVSPDGLTYVFTIASGVKFHNGDPLTSADVVFSMQRELAVQQGFASLWLPVLSSTGVTAPNSTAVQFKLNQVYAPFLGSLSLFFVVDKNLVMQHLANTTSSNPMGDWGVGWLTTNDAGSGPYMLQNWVRDTELTLTQFPGYWRGWANNPSPFKTVNYEVITDDATVLSLAKEGQLDWTSTFLAVPTYQSLQSMGWTWEKFPSANIFDFKLNTESAPLNNLDLRKAINYAFNYSAIPVILPGAVQSQGPIANGYQYHDAAVTQYTYNPTQAKADLAASGLNPSSITLTLTYVSGNIPEQQMAAEFQKDMQSVLGITVNIQPQTWQTITQLAASPSTTPQISEVYYDPLYPDADSFVYPQYDTVSNGTWISMEWVQNSTINSQIAQERASLNSTQRQQIFNELQVELTNMAPDVFVFNQPYYVALSPHVKGYTFYAGMSFDYDLYSISSVYSLSSG
jgi:peptide/nickel transport system substrate-binding protein